MIILKKFKKAGYTLMEVVAASAVLAVGMTGAVSLSTSIMAQEEITWRVAVARNYQENAVRLWQLGLTPAEVLNLVPSTTGTGMLPHIVADITLTPGSTADEDSLGTMESATCDVTLNSAGFSDAGAGHTNSVTAYRPFLK